MRADARANRQALVDAARRLYAVRGATVPLTAIAEHAGVGIGTLYRHFPTADDLVIGVIEDLRRRILASCELRAPEVAADPDRGWLAFVTDIVALDLGALLPRLVEARGDLQDLPPAMLSARAEILTAVVTVFDVAKSTGVVRAEVDPLHFFAGLAALTRPLPENLRRELPDLQPWLVDVYLAGLRADPGLRQ